LEAGNLSPKALCEDSFGGPETGSELLHLLRYLDTFTMQAGIL
jgi:hypothetical protein